MKNATLDGGESISVSSHKAVKNFLTIDVEDYYQVSAFENIVGPSRWEEFPSRVLRNTRTILEILEECGVKATFFILGWVAEKFPELVKEIDRSGHEVACHSYYHRLVYRLSPEEFKRDTERAKRVLEEITGKKILGYRAPSYSITQASLWALPILEELGFRYDSSIFPIMHDRYGMADSPRFKYVIPDHSLVEYPISTSLVLGRKVPVSGGGYFRLLPYWFTRMALKKINSQESQPFVFYLHPWEVDFSQPRMKDASAISKFRHYVNLSRTEQRFRRLLQDFQFQPISSFSE